VRTEYVPALGRGPFDHIEDPVRYRESFLWTSRHYLYDAFQERAAALGLDVILDGWGGELGPTCWGLDYLVELAAGFRWIALAGELARARRRSGRNPIRLLGGKLLASLNPNTDFRPMVLFTAEFRQECAVRPGVGRRWPNQQRSQKELLRLFRHKHANVQTTWPPPPVPYSYPFVDKRVVEFCIAAPPRLKVRDGYERCLIRDTLDGILPRKIQRRTTKMPFAPDYYVRYNEQLDKAREFVAAIRPADPVRGIVDVERLKSMLVPVDPLVGKSEALISIPGTIYLILFLRQFAEFRS
jgi:asparagine synthase (glutamine-hydrolysing)